MAERRTGPRRGRLRTTVGAVVVVAVALVVGALVLVGLLRGTLRDGLETTAEQRASALADQIEAARAAGRPGWPPGDEDEGRRADESWSAGDRRDGHASRRRSRGAEPLPTERRRRGQAAGRRGRSSWSPRTPGRGQDYVVRSAVARGRRRPTAALVPLLLVGVPLVLLVVGGTTWWWSTGRCAPVERIRREVDADHRRPARPAGARAGGRATRSPAWRGP